MAAYRRVDVLVTSELTDCTPGSAPGTTIGNEYGRTLPFYQPLMNGWT